MSAITDPWFMTYLCFALWLAGTMGFFLLQVLKPIPIYGKMEWRNWRHLILPTAIMAWLAMWCFRSLV